jgi:hypothetical protein
LFSIASFKLPTRVGPSTNCGRSPALCDHWTYKTPGHPLPTCEILDLSKPDG